MSRKGLMEQDLSKLDVTQLHPLSPEVISRQATINIGNGFFLPIFAKKLYMHNCCLLVKLRLELIIWDWIEGTIGHVAHGKSTVVKAISGVQVI